jgi:predicted nucleic acid-binding protein
VIVVDTSVWIEANRRPLGALPNALRGLIDADEVALSLPVRLELIAGVKGAQRDVLRRVLSGTPVLLPTEGTWRTVERWIPKATDKGHRFGLTDLLIAALADDIGGLVWSLDEDFGRMEQLKMVHRYSPL